MCAIDALGIPFLAGRSARIHSRDPETGDPIEVGRRIFGSLLRTTEAKGG